jgi:1,5-anhydro-D-fructose reductase (1,5-anhydro-D-mannitol-forming)
MLRVAMLSKWHVHAAGYANLLKTFGNVEITAVWDEEQERGRSWAAELGAVFEEDLDILLRREDVDGVVVDAPTSQHTAVMKAAAQAGKHIFTEKAMALTIEECRRISDEVARAGVRFGISFPARTTPTSLFAKQTVDANLLGDITVLRIRNGHNGSLRNWLPEYWYDEKQTGGGAMMDLGCHPMYLASWLLGKPSRITSMFSHYTGRAVEDNAQCSIEFENKAVAFLETSLVTHNSPMALELYGTEGTLLISGDSVKLTSRRLDDPVAGWIHPSKLPQAHAHPLKQWVDGILGNAPILYGLEEGIRLTELLEAAYIAHKEQRQVEFK